MALLLVAAGIIWAACAPLQVGGRASYVIISGVSMEPRFHYGDLVIVQQASVYRVGDIVAYRNADIKGNVFHRIVGQELDRFIMQGDNNAWLDSYQPAPDEIIGKLWVHLPGVGKAIRWVRVPLNMAFTVGILGGVVMASTILDTPERKGNKKGKKQTGGAGSSFVEAALFGLGFLLLASLALGIYAFTHPVITDADPLYYEHTGTFSYSAVGTPGVYDTRTIQTGEPIFPALTCSLDLQFAYLFSSQQLHLSGGTYQVVARVSEEQSNWGRTLPILEQTEFTGDAFTADFTLDLCQVVSLVETMEETTDFHPGTYTLTILPTVTTAGTFSEEAFQSSFEPGLSFRFDKLHFSLEDFDPAADPLNPILKGMLADPNPVPNLLSLFGLKFKDLTLRLMALLGFILAAIGIVLLLSHISNAARSDPRSYINMKYGGMLVNVTGKDPGLSSHPLQVASIDELAKLAERNNVMILHEQKSADHFYYVNCDGKTYRYDLPAGESPAPVKRAARRITRQEDGK